MTKKFELTEQNYRYLFENASNAMWFHDLRGNIVDANKACEKLTGYTQEELTVMNITRFLVSEEYLSLARKVRCKLLAGESIDQPYEQRLIRKDGTTKIVNMATSSIVIDGEVVGFQHVARDVTEEKQLREKLRLYVQQITRAQEDERKRLARQLHDEVSPPLLLLIQRLDSVASHTRPELSESLKDTLEGLRNQAIEAVEGLRRCAQDLRPRILDDLGLVPAIEWMAEDLAKNHGIDARTEVIGTEQSLLPEVELLLFRIAQEALSNIRRHAEATKALITLKFKKGKFQITISDDGKGFELPETIEDLASISKFGLAGIQERSRLLGATLRIQTKPGEGTQVVVAVTVPE